MVLWFFSSQALDMTMRAPVQTPKIPRPLRQTRAFAHMPWLWAVSGALTGFLVAMLAYAPASWLAAVLQFSSGQRVVLEDVRGTVWNASARLTLSGGAGSVDAKTLPGRVHWRAVPKPWGLAVSVRADCCMRQAWDARLAGSWSGLQLQMADHASDWPAELLTGLGTPWNTIQAQGRLRLSSDALVVQWLAGRLRLDGRVQLEAQDMSSRLSTVRPMGSYRLILQGGSSPSLALETISGALQLTGQGQWVGQRLRFSGQASAAAGFEGVLSNLLNIIGRRQGERSIIQLG